MRTAAAGLIWRVKSIMKVINILQGPLVATQSFFYYISSSTSTVARTLKETISNYKRGKTKEL